jgi:hypothetical protein
MKGGGCEGNPSALDPPYQDVRRGRVPTSGNGTSSSKRTRRGVADTDGLGEWLGDGCSDGGGINGVAYGEGGS